MTLYKYSLLKQCSEGLVLMTSSIAISAFMPSIVSSGIFSTRRANSGVDALSANNPFVGAMNMDIAAGQVANAAKGIATIAKEEKNVLYNGIVSAENMIKTAQKSNKFVNGLGKVVNFTADNINPVIVGTSVIKVATAKDKEDAVIQEGIALPTMFLFEAGAKRFVGMPINKKFDPKTMEITKDGLYQIIGGKKELVAKAGMYKIIDGKKVSISREGLYKSNPFLNKQAKAINDFCETKKLFNKSLKFVPGVLKGSAFVCASIAGYKLGTIIADEISEACGDSKKKS